MDYSNQNIVDLIETELLGIVSVEHREGILDAVFTYLDDNRANPEEDSE